LLPPPDISSANDNRLLVSYHLCTTQHAGGAQAVLGAATVLEAAIHPTERQNSLLLESSSRYMQQNKNLNNDNIFYSLQVLPGLLPKSRHRDGNLMTCPRLRIGVAIGVSRYESVVLADIFKIMGVNPSLNMPAEIRIIS
jgi:hypothetical protein